MAEPKKDDVKSLPDRLVADPKDPPELTMMQGWLGASSEAGYRRLYLDPELAQSLEIPDDAIVHTQEIPAATSPLGGQWVWVKADAAIKQGPGIERLYARFLRGQIQQDFLAGVAGAGAVGTVGAPIGNTSPAVCSPIPRTVFNCPTQPVWCRTLSPIQCPTRLTLCPTRQLICPPHDTAVLICAATGVMCQTPSAVDACPSAPGGCNPGTIFQQTIAQQPAAFQGGFAFDPGAAAGGFVGGPNLATRIIACFQTRPLVCQTQVPHLCPLTRAVVCSPVNTAICPVSAAAICTIPSAVDACPSAPGGCDPGTVFQQTTAQLPFAAQGLGFDPGAAAGGFGGGFVGAANPVATPIGATAPALCQVSHVIICRPTFVVQQCVTRSLQTCPTSLCTIPPQCHIPTTPPVCPPPTLAVHVCPPPTTPPAGCLITGIACPSLAGCPSGPVCGDPGNLGVTDVFGQGAAGIGAAVAFDPNAAFAAGGGLVGGPAGPFAPANTSPALCAVVLPSRVLACTPSILVQTCPTRFCTVACPTRFCPTLGGCPSFGGCPSIACGGGFPQAGGGF
jgi:hypothetical protein